MPPNSRLLQRLFRHEPLPHISPSAPPLSQRISRPAVTLHATRPSTRSFTTHLRSARLRPQLRYQPGPSSSFSPRPQNRTQSQTRLFRRLNSNSAKPNSSANAGSLSQRLKKLSREYGWSALGIYLFLSALDFPFCFAAVRLLGVDRIGYYEHVAVEGAKNIFKSVWPFQTDEASGDSADTTADGQAIALEPDSEQAAAYDHGVVDAQKRREKEGASTFSSIYLLCSDPSLGK
jgi:hypothetical protein